MVVLTASSFSNVISFFYNFAQKLSTTLPIYLLGYFNFSVTWLLGALLISLMREELKKENEMKREMTKESAVCYEKEKFLARVSDLPSWVFFPDVERAEWLNRIMKIVWPNVNHLFAPEVLIEMMEPKLQASLEPYMMGDIKCESIVLGNIPPRIGGIKVYDRKVSRSEIMMDLDVYYAGNSEMTFNVKGMKGGIKDLQFHGLLRVVMKPLIPRMPLIGGLEFFFLNNPEVDFNLVGVIDIFYFPLLRDILHRSIKEQLASMMVFPKKLPIILSDDVSAQILRNPAEVEGMLRVHLLETRELKKTENDVQQRNDEFKVYAHINVGAQTYKSNSIMLGKGNHKWDFCCEILLDNYEQELQIVLCDSRNDDLLGRAALNLKSICHDGKTDMWLTLEDFISGRVHVIFTWHVLTFDPKDLTVTLAETQLLKPIEMSSALFTVYVDSCTNLLSPGPITRNKPDPFAVLSLGYKQEKTLAAMHTDDPVWKEGFTFLVQDPETDTLSVKVMDQKTNVEIGSFVYHLLSLMEQEFMDIPCRPFHLMHSGPVTKINLAMQLRILKKWEGEKHKDEPKKKTKAPLPPPPSSNRPLNASVRSEGAVRKVAENWKNKAMAGSSASLPALHFAPEGPVRKTPAASKKQLPTMARMMKPISSGVGQQVTAVHTRPANAGKFNLGVIQLTLRYDVACFRLLVVVHKIVNLPLIDPKHMPSSYVKLHFLTERSHNSKRKTLIIKDDCNPVFNEIFDFIISEVELASRKLKVSVVTRNGIFSSSRPYTGHVIINLAKLDLKQGITHWFDICP